jgi:hypothetical protein
MVLPSLPHAHSYPLLPARALLRARAVEVLLPVRAPVLVLVLVLLVLLVLRLMIFLMVVPMVLMVLMMLMVRAVLVYLHLRDQSGAFPIEGTS